MGNKNLQWSESYLLQNIINLHVNLTGADIDIYKIPNILFD